MVTQGFNVNTVAESLFLLADIGWQGKSVQFFRNEVLIKGINRLHI